jgi:hypothetical protein
MKQRRYPYRAVQELEDMIAHQLALVAELRRSRKQAQTPAAWAYVDTQLRHAELVLGWLTTLRSEMQHGPDETLAQSLGGEYGD